MPINVHPVLAALVSELRAERQRIDRRLAVLQRLGRGHSSGGSKKAVKPRARRGWTKAARAAVSRRMKAYWAKRRRGKR